jgi:hypothetical protein
MTKKTGGRIHCLQTYSSNPQRQQPFISHAMGTMMSTTPAPEDQSARSVAWHKEQKRKREKLEGKEGKEQNVPLKADPP